MSDNYCCRNSWKSDNYMGSNTEKKPWTNLQNSSKNWSKRIKSDNFCYRKVGRAITKWGAIKKSPILLSQYWKIYDFLRVAKIISHFDGSNNIFVDCIIEVYLLMYYFESHLIYKWQTIFNQLNIMVSYLVIFGLCHSVAILWEIYVMRRECHVKWLRFHFKRMLITGLNICL